MAKTKKEELTEGVDAPSVDNLTTESDVVKEVTTFQEVENGITEEATVEMVAKSLLDDALAEIERLKAVITDSEDEKESLKESLEQAYEVIEELNGGPVVETEEVDLLSFEFEGETYQFTKDAPTLILWNGEGISQQQIIEDEELLLQLIGSNLGLIIKK